MISFFNTYGQISLTNGYFAELVSTAAKNSFGVAGMATRSGADNLKSFVVDDYPEKGVSVREDNGKLIIELHIKVTYGLNIAAAVKSITHKVRYIVEEATGLTVKRINVSVDDVVS